MSRLFILLIFSLFPLVSYAKIYKCVDNTGKVIFKTDECEADEKSELISDKEYGVDYKVNENRFGYSDGVSFAPSFRKVRKISDGEKVNLRNYLVNGATTAFYFYADWCGSCRKIGPLLEKKAKESGKLALRKIDVTRTDSPVRGQYKVDSIPYFIVYDKNGKLISQGNSPGF